MARKSLKNKRRGSSQGRRSVFYHFRKFSDFSRGKFRPYFLTKPPHRRAQIGRGQRAPHMADWVQREGNPHVPMAFPGNPHISALIQLRAAEPHYLRGAVMVISPIHMTKAPAPKPGYGPNSEAPNFKPSGDHWGRFDAYQFIPILAWSRALSPYESVAI